MTSAETIVVAAAGYSLHRLLLTSHHHSLRELDKLSQLLQLSSLSEARDPLSLL